jgi:hypothetical protein
MEKAITFLNARKLRDRDEVTFTLTGEVGYVMGTPTYVPEEKHRAQLMLISAQFPETGRIRITHWEVNTVSKKKKIVWFARGGDIARCGPYESQIEAVNVMRLVKKPGQNQEFPPDVFVWPEEEKK